jgi:cytochrome P450
VFRKYKDQCSLTGVFAVNQPQILITDGEMAKNILIKNFRNFSTNEFTDMIDQNSDPLLSLNPFFLKGEEWKEKRNEITPAFTVNRVRNERNTTCSVQ